MILVATRKSLIGLLCMAMLAGVMPVTEAACDLVSLAGPWGFLSTQSSAKRNGQAGTHTLLMRARLQASGVISGIIFRNRQGYIERAWQETTGVYGIGPTCNVYLFWRDPVGSRYTVKGFVSEDGKTFFGAGQAEGFAFSLLGQKI